MMKKTLLIIIIPTKRLEIFFFRRVVKMNKIEAFMYACEQLCELFKNKSFLALKYV